ncbi:uncharacterized protein si:dkey-27h10.2 isoform X2 [Electrophorus electricus]|uniref:uncharacterized protein si:dkey-27h10.2 isoform X2 n=1 Tax=Electrophorus electricus TaxID=8005 RepID=UPI0015D0044E|nr:uncharacterized protein si:dkey-27h10.2 isoform X2 [Electrophorus electricus]
MAATIRVLTVLGALMILCSADEVTTNVTVALTSVRADSSSVMNNMDINFMSYSSTVPESPVGVSSTLENETFISVITAVSKLRSTLSSTTHSTTQSAAVSKHRSTLSSTTHSTTQSAEIHESYKLTYIIIFVLLMMCLAAAITCYTVQRNQRRFSLDLQGKNTDAQIPLSDVEPEVFESHPPKDMQTFAAVEASSTGGLEMPGGEKGLSEACQQVKDSPAEVSDTGARLTGEGELTIVDLNDKDTTISTKTSMESLDEPLNDNNSNNKAQARVHDASGSFTDVCLNDLP